MLDMIFQFLGYTFAFWIMWKLFDKIYHHIRGDVQTGCPGCDRQEIKIIGLKAEVDTLIQEREAGSSRRGRRIEEARKDKDELLAIKILNTAGEGTLEDIYGIGPVKTKLIMNARPFYSWQDVEKTVPGFKRYIISWSKKWERSFVNHLRP